RRGGQRPPRTAVGSQGTPRDANVAHSCASEGGAGAVSDPDGERGRRHDAPLRGTERPAPTVELRDSDESDRELRHRCHTTTVDPRAPTAVSVSTTSATVTPRAPRT